MISLCMIVKNEEAVLERCLTSAAGLYDELIVVDTGSTDRTAEIVLDAGGTVLHYDWQYPGNKGEARNMGIDAASGEWIVILDADEVVCEPLKLREMLQSDSDFDAISVQFNNFENGQINLSWRQPRIFRRGKFAYKYREHEIPVAIVPDTVMKTADVVFEHRTPEDRKAGKSDPMIHRLARDVDENPDDPHPLYFYFRECVNQNENSAAITLGNAYLELTAGGSFIQSDCYAHLAIAHQRLGNVTEARKSLHLAIAEEPTRREWWYRLGVLHTNCGEWNLAIAVLKAAAEIIPDHRWQWEPQTTARIYDLIQHCQQRIAHSLAHSHTH